jgi:isopentenyl phosphate kinase
MQLLKLGGSVITNKHEPMAASQENIEQLARVIGKIWKNGVRDLIVIHGAGSFGHHLVITYGIEKGVKNDSNRIGYAYTHTSCTYLSGLLIEALLKNNVPAISIPPSVIIKQTNGRISEFNEKIVFEYLRSGYLPVLHGDMVLDKKIGGSVCSGDQIVAYLAKKATRIIFGTDVDGIFADGKLVPLITKKNFKNVLKHVGGSGAPDVTGGMLGKIKELKKVKKPVYIVNATKAERVESLLLGKKTICTEIKL